MYTSGIGGLGEKGGIPCPFNNGDSGREGLNPSSFLLSGHVDTILGTTNLEFVLSILGKGEEGVLRTIFRGI